jgi:hypothetical protein
LLRGAFWQSIRTGNVAKAEALVEATGGIFGPHAEIKAKPAASGLVDQRAHELYPHGRPGYVVDHIIPLKRGGADAPWNMQWQTIAAGKAKDATE